MIEKFNRLAAFTGLGYAIFVCAGFIAILVLHGKFMYRWGINEGRERMTRELVNEGMRGFDPTNVLPFKTPENDIAPPIPEVKKEINEEKPLPPDAS